MTRSTAWTLVATALLAGCASGLKEADRSFASGDYLQAAAAYETYVDRHPTAADADDALFRLALAYTVPESRVYDRSRAAATLELLVKRHPQSPHRPAAGVLLGLLGRLDEVEAEAARTSERLAAAETAGVEAKKAHDEQVARLRASLTESEAQARRLRDELNRLKSIDLRR